MGINLKVLRFIVLRTQQGKQLEQKTQYTGTICRMVCIYNEERDGHVECGS